jgi:hypothetical protein
MSTVSTALLENLVFQFDRPDPAARNLPAKDEWSKALPIVWGLLILIYSFPGFSVWHTFFAHPAYRNLVAPACALGKLLQNKSSLEANHGVSIQTRRSRGLEPEG